MENKLIALVFIALLAGLGGGYGLGHVTYQPQIQNLQNSLNDLYNRVDTIDSTLGNTQSSVTVLQNEMDTLNSEVTSIDSTVGEIENRTWYRALRFEENGTGSVMAFFTDNFQINGKWIRLRWIVEASYVTLEDYMEGSWFSINIWFADGTEYTERRDFFLSFSSMSTDIAIVPGEYYLTIGFGSAVTKMTLIVWDYY